MELGMAAHRVEIAPLRLICDQVIAAQIVESAGQPLAKVAVVVKENTSGSLCHLAETYLRAIEVCLPLRFRSSDLRGLAEPGATTLVAGGEREGLTSARIERGEH